MLPDDADDFHTFFFYNFESFDLENYGSESIKRVSRLYHKSVSPDLPKQFNHVLQKTELNDDTDFLQIGGDN